MNLMQFVLSSTWNCFLNSSIKSDSVTFSKSEKYKVGIHVTLAASFGIGQNSVEHFDKESAKWRASVLACFACFTCLACSRACCAS